MVDSSDGVDFARMKAFTKYLLQRFDISQKGTHVAYVVYANGANLRFSFPVFSGPRARYTRDDVRKFIDDAARAPGNQRNVRIGLQLAKSAFDYGGRRNARRVFK